MDATSVIWGSFLPGLSFADSILVLTLGAGLLLNSAMMAFALIPIDLTTIMVSTIAIGVGVDSAIYLVIQYRRELAAAADLAAATERTLLVTLPSLLALDTRRLARAARQRALRSTGLDRRVGTPMPYSVSASTIRSSEVSAPSRRTDTPRFMRSTPSIRHSCPELPQRTR
jgi:hypothetical protein